EVMAQSLMINSQYIALGLFVDGVVRPAVNGMLSVEKDSRADSCVSVALAMVSCLAIARCFLDNQVLSAAMVQAGTLDNPRVSTACPCDTQTRLMGMAESHLYALGESAYRYYPAAMMPAPVASAASLMYVPNKLFFQPALAGRSILESAVADHMCTT